MLNSIMKGNERENSLNPNLTGAHKDLRKKMKMKKINRGDLYTLLIFFFLVGIASFNMTKDWATALVQGIVAGLVSSFIYIVGYLNGKENTDKWERD